MKNLFQITGLIFIISCLLAPAYANAVSVSIVTDKTISSPPVQHGIKKIQAALDKKNIILDIVTSLDKASSDLLIVAGISNTQGPSDHLHKIFGIPVPIEAESLMIHQTEYKGKELILATGADERGLMYALLDIADRIGWAKDNTNLFEKIQSITESPEVVERALSMYTMNKAVFESFFYDESYWVEYLDMMAQNRYNTFALLFGYENAGYFSPPYPQFFDVEQFPDVKVIGVTKERQQKNVKMLKKIIQMTHDRGMNFTLGIWDHIYRGGVQGPAESAKTPTADVIWGLNADNLSAYTKAALTKFVRMFPELNAIQFRMHGESGLRRSEMDDFWTMIYQVLLDNAPQMRFDARAKNFPHHLIDKAVDMGVNMRICTKYWMEQMGLPFHPTHINKQNQKDRRHGYADMLRYPKRYNMHWRLWNSGTTRVLQWGDPEYVRRFVESTHLYDGQGFEVSEPMTTKMQDHPHDGQVFDLLSPKYKYYKWDFQRYWYFHQLFGRLGYNPETSPETWEYQFQERFGSDAFDIEKAMNLASKVLPRIVASSYPYSHFPTTRGWAEKQRQGDLPSYANIDCTDTQQFLSPKDAATCILTETDSAKIWPQQNAEWFAEISDRILEHVNKVENSSFENTSPEYISTITDLKILAYLARYHSYRCNGGAWHALFTQSGNIDALDKAIDYEQDAVKSWAKLVEAAGDVFTFDLRMGRRSAGLSGHWRDELVALQTGLERLKQQRKEFKPTGSVKQIPVRTPDAADILPPALQHSPPVKVFPEKQLKLTATITDPSGIKWVRLCYRSVNQFFDYKSIDMQRIKNSDRYEAIIPADDIPYGWDFMYLFEVMDNKHNGKIYPNLQKEAPYIIIELER